MLMLMMEWKEDYIEIYQSLNKVDENVLDVRSLLEEKRI